MPSDAAPTSAEPAPRPRALIPWIVSVTVHLALVIAAGFIVWSVVEPAEIVSPVRIDFDAPAFSPAPADPRPQPNEQAIAQSIPEPTPRDTPPETIEPLDTLQSALNAPANTTSFFDEAPATAPRDFAPPPETQRADFAGLGASDARDIVYVVDASGSMITTMPEVLSELRRSIAALHPMQRFQVLIFQSDEGGQWRAPAPLQGVSRTVLLDATPAIKRAVFAWLDEILPRGRSNPMPALEAALALKPDAIFLLSAALVGVDEEDVDPDRILARLDELNPRIPPTHNRRVAIKTIQVIDRDPQSLLKRIGETHGGGNEGHRFISRREFNLHGSANPSP
ncbi:MAG: hypothetical protein VYC34_01485 [Planctomycetota bacterium]|nr:hypothetical protein [Planctomycetota bacterium]